jgi:hypothetical protein
MKYVDWIRMEIGKDPPEVLTRRPWREKPLMEQYTRADLDQIYDWPVPQQPQPAHRHGKHEACVQMSAPVYRRPVPEQRPRSGLEREGSRRLLMMQRRGQTQQPPHGPPSPHFKLNAGHA